MLTSPTPPWGLDRIDQRGRTLDDVYRYDVTGQGVTAYVVDTGIRLSHDEFSGRASYGYDFYENDSNANDCNGHGTHVAGIIGGETYGVAKEVSLVALRITNCNGGSSTGIFIDAIDWLSANAVKPSIVNASVSWPESDAVDNAVEGLLAERSIQLVTSAGNNDYNACSYSPNRVSDIITVGASDQYDSIASFSNWGTCIDWFAPGVNIRSAGIGSDTDYRYADGTSQSAPFTAGVAALYLEQFPNATAHNVRTDLYNYTTKDAVTGTSTYNNHLLYSLVETNRAPSADFSYTVSGNTVYFTDESTDPDGSVVEWRWEFGDGGYSPYQNPVHTYSGGGSYMVELWVTDNEEATSYATRLVKIPFGK